MKRKRSQWDDQSPRNSTRQNYLESQNAPSPAIPELEASLLSTKRTSPTRCRQQCAERCSRASPTPSPPPPSKRRALSRSPPTSKRRHRSTSAPLHSVFPLASFLQHDHSPPRLDLTEENLRKLESIPILTDGSSAMSAPRNPSPTRKESVRTHMKRLAGYNITLDHGTPFPDELARFVKMLGIPREEAPSPHAQAVIDTRRAAAMENESTGRRIMEGHLLFNGEAHAGGMPGLTLKDQVNLVKDYLPPPPRSTVPELWGTLPRPQPDSCIGYITATEAKTHKIPLTVPFSREEDDIAEWFNVVHHSDTHFPFLTAQWKAAMSGENQIDARLQAARDGALIVNYMHQFYSHAYPERDPSQLETCHVSLTTDMISSFLWLHWREVEPTDGEVYYRMEPIESAHLHKLSDVAEMRRLLHNYIDYAMGERLMSIKAALPPFWQNRPAKRARRTQSQSSTTASSLNLQLDMPITPSSSSRGGENASPTKTLKRTFTDGM